MLRILFSIVTVLAALFSLKSAFAANAWIPAVNYYFLSAAETTTPQITGQKNLSFAEEQSFELLVSDFIISDKDSTSFSLYVEAGANYQVQNNIIQPEQNFYGQLTIPVRVSDGANNSEQFIARVQITNVNDAPVVLSSYSIDASSIEPLDILFTGLFSDVDGVQSAESFSLTLVTKNVANLNTTNGSFSRKVADGQVYYTYSANAGFSGQEVVDYWVTDEQGAQSDVGQLVINVAPSPQPKIEAQATITMLEDTTLLLSANDFTIIDYDSSTHTIIPQPGTNYTVNGSTITPRKDFFGQLQVPVIASDGSYNSAVFNALVQVQNVNDAPVALLPYTLNLKQNGSINFFLTGLFSDKDGVNDTTIFYLLNKGADCSTSCRTQNGTVTRTSSHLWASYYYVPDNGYSGTDSIEYSIKDSSGAVSNISRLYFAVSELESLKISGQHAIQMNEDTTLQLSSAQFVITGAPQGTPVTIVPLAGEKYSINNDLVVPDQDYFGTLSVDVIARAGSMSSGIFKATVQVQNVNDAPTALAPYTLNLNQNNSINFFLMGLFHDKDGVNDTTIFNLLVDGADCGTSCRTQNGTVTKTADHQWASYRYTPDNDYFGTDSIQYAIRDASAAVSNTSQLSFAVSGSFPQPVVKRFEWQENPVYVGQPTTFYWDIENVSGCYALTAGEGHSPERPAKGQTVAQIYTEPREHLTRWYCTDLAGNRFPANANQYLEAPQSIKAVPQPSVKKFEWVPAQVEVGEETVFYWEIENVSHCTAVTAGTGNDPQRTSSGQTLAQIYTEPREHTTKWFCTDLAGNRFPTDANEFLTANQSVTDVIKPKVNRFEWVPAQVEVGEPTAFFWDVENVTGCTAVTAGQGSDPDRAPSGQTHGQIYNEPGVHVTKWFCTDTSGNRFPQDTNTFLEATRTVVESSNQTSSNVIYIHTDVLGSVIAESDSKGELIKKTDYKPFGESRNQE